MRQLMLKLWKDDGGTIYVLEFIFMATILVLGLITGLTTVRNAISNELAELANAIGALQQCYSFAGTSGCCVFTCGSAATDTCDTFDINVCFPATVCPADSVECP
jgi:Flp pilus assembly pilin Flp